jgi:peptide/nickel transport system substrate-binding protein
MTNNNGLKGRVRADGTMLSRREIIALGGAAFLAAAVPFKSAFAQEEAKDPNQTLKILTLTTSPQWSPLFGGSTSLLMASIWWASPMYFDTEGNLNPYVYIAWEGSDAQDVWTFQIDPKAVFSDGSPITSAEIKGGLELSAVPSTKHQRIDQVIGNVKGFSDVYNGGGREISGIVAVDSHTVRFELSQPDPVFFLRMSSHLAPVIKPEQARDANGEEVFEWWQPGNGTAYSGPFRPTMMDTVGLNADFVRNDNFFGPRPHLDKIELRHGADATTSTALLQRGEFDAHMELLTPTLIQDLGADFATGPIIPRGHHFWLSQSSPPTDDIKVRQALIMAVDRDALMKLTFPDGPNQKADQVMNAVPGVDPDYVPYPYDPDAARKALAESSYGTADNFPPLIMQGIVQTSQVAAQYIAEQWRQVLGVDRLEMRTQADSATGADQNSTQIFRDDVATRVPDATIYLMGAIHSSSGNAKAKMGGYANAKIDELLEKARLLPVTDPHRDELAREAQRLFREDWMYIPWHYTTRSKFALPYVKGIDRNLDWNIARPWAVYRAAH